MEAVSFKLGRHGLTCLLLVEVCLSLRRWDISDFQGPMCRRAGHGRSAEQGYEVRPRACGNRTGRFARHGRSTRPRDGHDADRQMPSGLGAAQESLPVGLRLGKIRTGQAQNLVGFAQLAIFAFQALMRSRSSLVGPGRWLASVCWRRIQPCRVCAAQPIFGATARWPPTRTGVVQVLRTMRTARSRTSGE